MPPNLGFAFLLAKAWTGSSSTALCDMLPISCCSATGAAGVSGIRVFLGSSGVDPLLLKE
jgi:hypothetical protein